MDVANNRAVTNRSGSLSLSLKTIKQVTAVSGRRRAGARGQAGRQGTRLIALATFHWLLCSKYLGQARLVVMEPDDAKARRRSDGNLGRAAKLLFGRGSPLDKTRVCENCGRLSTSGLCDRSESSSFLTFRCGEPTGLAKSQTVDAIFLAKRKCRNPTCGAIVTFGKSFCWKCGDIIAEGQERERLEQLRRLENFEKQQVMRDFLISSSNRSPKCWETLTRKFGTGAGIRLRLPPFPIALFGTNHNFH
jgi:hypothetical protein